jgi:hypothetical protein
LALIFPNKLHLIFFFNLLILQIPPQQTSFSYTMDLNLSKHIECLSQWPAHLPAGLPTVGALLLLATGGLAIACKVWTFVRVLLSLFVLPGKPVHLQSHPLRSWVKANMIR